MSAGTVSADQAGRECQMDGAAAASSGGAAGV